MPELRIYPISDLRLRVEVQDRLWRADGLDAAEVEVQVNHCEVSLTGVVWSPDDVRRVEAVALAVEGVKRVRTHLMVHGRDGGLAVSLIAP
ncbi:MAG: BON domain-containing protein [Phenylobacterium sp.]